MTTTGLPQPLESVGAKESGHSVRLASVPFQFSTDPPIIRPGDLVAPGGIYDVADFPLMDAGDVFGGEAGELLSDNLFLNETITTVQAASLPVESQRILIALYTVTTTLAVVGNLLVIAVFVVGKRSRTDLRTFLLNLAVADLIMAVFCMPFTFSTTMLHDWIFGPQMCTLVLFMQAVSVTASVGTSTVIAIDRYLVVAHPLRSRGSARCRAKFAIAAIWTIAGILCSVQLVVGRMTTAEVSPGVFVDQCTEMWPDPSSTWKAAYTFFLFMHTYLVPLTIIGLAYSLIGWKLWSRKTPGNADEVRDYHQLQSKIKVIKMLVIVVCLFAVCWLPLHIFFIVMDFQPQLDSVNQAEASSVGAAVYTTVHWLAMSNSFVNSIVYGFLNDSFRSDLRWMFGRYFRWLPPCRDCAQPQFSDTAFASEYNHAPGVTGLKPTTMALTSVRRTSANCQVKTNTSRLSLLTATNRRLLDARWSDSGDGHGNIVVVDPNGGDDEFNNSCAAAAAPAVDAVEQITLIEQQPHIFKTTR